MELTQLHLKEYDKLQNEISQTLAEIGSIEIFSVISSGTIFAWFLIHGNEMPHKMGFFLPAVLVVLFGLITLGLFNRIKLIGEYIKNNYEKLMNTEQNPKSEFGWEHYLDKSLKKGGSLLANGRLGMWIFHLFTDVGIAIFLASCKG